MPRAFLALNPTRHNALVQLKEDHQCQIEPEPPLGPMLHVFIVDIVEIFLATGQIERTQLWQKLSTHYGSACRRRDFDQAYRRVRQANHQT